MNRKIAELINSLGKEMQESDQLCTEALSNKLKKCASIYPQDKTIGALSIVVASLSKKNDFITKKTFSDLYSKHYTTGTVASDLLSNELGLKAEAQKEVNEPKTFKPVNFSEFKSDELVKKLFSDRIFKETKVAIASTTIKQAEEKVMEKLATVLQPISVKVIDSNNDAIIAVASYESPKGITNIYVPLTKNLEGDVFVGNKVVAEINKDNIKDYILKNAGQKLNVSSKQVLNLLTNYVAPEQSKTELAATALKLKTAKMACDGILGIKIAENKETLVEIPKSGEFATLEEKFASPWGIALENFGERVLKRAATVIQSTLNQINSPAVKINLLKSADTTLVFNVLSKSGKTFTVPVKVSGGNCLSPEIAIVNGSITKLDKTFEDKLASQDLDKDSFVHVANLAVLNPKQLISVAKQYSESKEFDKMAAALDVLKEKDVELYKNAYKFILDSNLTKEASKTGCNHLVTSKNSIYKVCSQTNLPENKIYQDENGCCRPLHRKQIDKANEGAFYMTSRILGQ